MKKNPYEILNVPQNANNGAILRAQMTAMREKKYTNAEIAAARAQLSKPASRLAADFTFPVFDDVGELEDLKTTVRPTNIDISTINDDKYNSL